MPVMQLLSDCVSSLWREIGLGGGIECWCHMYCIVDVREGSGRDREIGRGKEITAIGLGEGHKYRDWKYDALYFINARNPARTLSRLNGHAGESCD